MKELNQPNRIVQLLRECSNTLALYGRSGWSTWLAEDADKIEKGDEYGYEHFLSGFGGMGSLNDVVFHPLNGDDIPKEKINWVNEEFQSSLYEASDLARRFKRRNQTRTSRERQ